MEGTSLAYELIGGSIKRLINWKINQTLFLEAKVTFSDCFDFLICSRLRLKKRTCLDFRNINSRSFVFKDEFRDKIDI